jgi:type IV pilus assembly protein PilO
MNLKDAKTQKILLGCMALIAGGYIYFGTSLLPFNYPVRKAKIAELASEHEKLAAEVEKARKVVGDLARLEAEYERLHDQWLSAQELLPQDKEMPELLRQVTTAGSRSGVEFALFEPENAVPHDFYTDHPISVTVRGNYHQVGAFVGRLSNLDRIVNVSDMSLLQPNDKKSTKKRTTTSKKKGAEASSNDMVARSNNTVEAKFTLTAYTLTESVSPETINAQQANAKTKQKESNNAEQHAQN